MNRLVVLGGGTAGTMAVNKLHHKLDRKDWQITVVDRDLDHIYQPGLLLLPFGVYEPDELVKPRERFLPDGVELVLGEVDRVDAEANKVLLDDGRELDYDYDGGGGQGQGFPRWDEGCLYVSIIAPRPDEP